MPGDLLFIVGGILPIVYLAVRMFGRRNRPADLSSGKLGVFTKPG
jgi:nitric oxide reductase subunit B